MKDQRHKRRESFSVLLISNSDQSSRQFDISLPLVRFFLCLLLVILIVAGLAAYGFISRRGMESQLRSQLTQQEKVVQQLTTEKKIWKQKRLP